MIKRRSDLGGVIEASKHDKNALHSDMMKKQIESINSHSASKKATWASEEDLNDTFNTVISDSKKRKRQDTGK